MTIPRFKTTHTLIQFLAIALFFQAVGGLIGWFSSPGDNEWYASLERSPLNPPNYVFGIVWPVLYFLLSVSFFLILRSPESRERRIALQLFAVHMILNWAWTPVFVISENPLISLVHIVSLIVMAVFMMVNYYKKINPAAGLLFVPYILWLCLATHLTYYIWVHN